jgi:hypothetical protein
MALSRTLIVLRSGSYSPPPSHTNPTMMHTTMHRAPALCQDVLVLRWLIECQRVALTVGLPQEARSHELRECPLRFVSCKWCKDEMTADIRDAHEAECLQRPLGRGNALDFSDVVRTPSPSPAKRK